MRLGFAAAAIAGILAMPASSAAVQGAQQCDARAFGVQIDQIAQALRVLNRESETRFHERLEAIGKQRGWTEAQKADKAAASMDDGKLEAFNSDIEELVAQLDSLSATPNNEISCARLSELKTVQERLIAVMGQKSGFILAQLEAEGTKAPFSPYAQAPSPSYAQAPAPPAQPEPVQPPIAAAPRAATSEPAPSGNAAWSANVSQTPPASKISRAAPPPLAPPPAAPKYAAPAPDNRVASLTPPPVDAPPITQAPATGFTAEEIREAGKGVFGSLTSEFAVLINYAFKKYGQPNAYIVGDEGGGAFLAGLRYGDGKLYSRVNGVEPAPAKIYWQGPSIGADLGATGSHTVFLVYNLQDPATLYRRFPGIDGSAYVAGGLGMTVYQAGNTLIVPIRTGLGLRLGASIAYLKFTERASWNPF